MSGIRAIEKTSERVVRRGSRGLVVLGCVVATALTSTAVAEAAVKVWHGGDWAEATEQCMRANDGERDGNHVYGEAVMKNGNSHRRWDNTEDGRPSSWKCYPEREGKIARFRVCEDTPEPDNVRCSRWRHNPS